MRCSSVSSTSSRRCSASDAADIYLHDSRRQVLRCAAVHGLPERARGRRVPRRPRARRRGRSTRRAGDRGGLHRVRRAAAASGVRGLHGCDRRADRLVRRDARSPRRGLARRAILRRARPRADRRLRVARGGRASQRRDVRGALASGTRAARLLAHRNRARPAALAHEDARRGGAGRDGGARRALGRGADAERGRRARAGGLVRAAGEPRGDARRGPARLGRRPERLRRGASRDRGPVDRRRLALRPGVEGARPRGAGECAARRSARDEPAASSCGVVLVLFEEERRFTDDDLELAGQLAQAARGALGRSELYESERSARALAQQLARTGSLLATELDPDTVLEEVVQHAPPLLGADACAIRVLDADELSADRRERQGRRRARRNALADRPACSSGDVFQSRTSTGIADAREDARYAEADPVLAAGLPRVPRRSARRSRGHRPRRALALRRSGRERGGPRRSRRWRRSPRTRRPRSRTPSSSRRSPSTASGATRSSRTSPTGSSPSTASRASSSGTRPQSASRACPPATRSAARSRTSSSAASRPAAVQPGRLVAIQRGTEEVWLSVTEAVMRDPAGAVAGRIFAFRDISADRLVEEMKSEFVATVSHELRGPLTSIYGFAETLLREDVLFGEEERRTFLRYIASESERLTTIVDALLNVARLDSGDLQVDLTPTDVRAVVSEVVGTVDEPTSNGHRFVLDLPEAPLNAQADRDKLSQILSALARQRRKVLALRGHGHGCSASHGRRGRGHHRGRRSRHPAIRAGADLQKVLPRRRRLRPGPASGFSSPRASCRRWAATSSCAPRRARARSSRSSFRSRRSRSSDEERPRV